MLMRRRAVFLDLNGTLALPLKQERLSDLTAIAGAADAVVRLTNAGFVCPVVTVQSRIAKGLFSMDEFLDWFRGFSDDWKARGAILVGPYVCPHRYAERCGCEKPNAFLYERAIRDHDIDQSRSFVIGDSPDDVRAATAIGARGCLVLTGWVADPQVVTAAAPETWYVGETLDDIVDRILECDVSMA
jgi:histidinol-phosphate phosphatase family protein